MGCNNSSDLPNTHIEEHIKNEVRMDRSIKRLLFLGAGSSGKSTLFKQLLCIHGAGFDENETVEAARVIQANLITGIITLLKQSQLLYDSDNKRHLDCLVDLTDVNTQTSIQSIVELSAEFSDNIEEDQMERLQLGICTIWGLTAIKATLAKRSGRFSFPDNMDFFFDKAMDILKKDYQASEEDILKARIRTTGVVEKSYEIKDNIFTIVDVGGQRNERKKWIHCFTNVTAVIYVAALNHFNAVLFEDENRNAMHESLDIFEEICNSKWFRATEMILFLNKEDLFRAQLMKGFSLSICFGTDTPDWNGPQYWEGPDYTHSPDASPEQLEQQLAVVHEASAQFIQDVYIARNRFSQRSVYPHVTTATDRANVTKVFWDVQNIVIRSNLKSGGMMV